MNNRIVCSNHVKKRKEIGDTMPYNTQGTCGVFHKHKQRRTP